MNIIMLKAEFCYAPPNISPLYVSKTATYSTGMQPGTAAWSFFKTVALAPPFTNNVAAMFKGDSAVSSHPLQLLASSQYSGCPMQLLASAIASQQLAEQNSSKAILQMQSRRQQ
jgi:hypothetical protein